MHAFIHPYMHSRTHARQTCIVILPVDNNEHQRIDDVSTDRISYDILSVETMGFAM